MTDTKSQDEAVEFLEDIENILKNIGLETITVKNYENNEELESLLEKYLSENYCPVYLN
ncbi:MAG: hypothetical protein IID03_00235 [Candidatus Dadabacteria bacterium]|nr:hypothetical protein [Candidatus Dadabacteria bacterium]